MNESEKKAEEAWAKVKSRDFEQIHTLNLLELLLIAAKQGGLGSITGDIGELELDGIGKVHDAYFHVLIAVGSKREAKLQLFEQTFQNLRNFIHALRVG